MVHFSEKEISGKKYLYAVQSVRFGDRIAKISKRVDKPLLTDELQRYFIQKEKELMRKEAIKKYKSDSIFTKDQLGKLEDTKSDYKRILQKLSKPQKKDLFDRFTANFTYESNAIEGNSLTLKDVATVLFENKVPEGKDLREIYETRNSRRVVDQILANKFKLTEKDIISMHKILVDDMDIATGYKKIPNYIIGRNVKTTAPENVGDEISSLIEWFHSQDSIHPLRKAALFHGKFERIHPFDDGNGRVGRFLINVILINEGYAPLIIRKSQRITYLKNLEAFDHGHTGRMERFLLLKYKNTFKNFFQVYTKYI